MKVFLTLILAIFAFGACQTTTQEEKPVDPKPADKPATDKPAEKIVYATPTDALNGYLEGVKAKDEKKVRAALSADDNKALDKMVADLKKDKATIFDIEKFFEDDTEKPETKDEKIDGDKATVQVKMGKEGKWESLNFVKEDGSWKIAFGYGDLEKPKTEAPADKPKEELKTESKPEEKTEESKKEGEIPSDQSFSDGK